MGIKKRKNNGNFLLFSGIKVSEEGKKGSFGFWFCGRCKREKRGGVQVVLGFGQERGGKLSFKKERFFYVCRGFLIER